MKVILEVKTQILNHGGGSKQEGEEGNKQSSSNESQDNNIQYSMRQNSILTQSKETNWEELKIDIENFYSSWSVIVLDLYKQNINNNDILNFGKELDNAIVAIKNEDKIATLNTLTKMYSYIPIYTTSFLDNNLLKVYQTKSNILNAYSLVEQNNESEFKNELIKAEEAYLPILSNIEQNLNKQNEINKVYVLLKDMQAESTKNDKDIFYMKYKNIMEQLNFLS